MGPHSVQTVWDTVLDTTRIGAVETFFCSLPHYLWGRSRYEAKAAKWILRIALFPERPKRRDFTIFRERRRSSGGAKPTTKALRRTLQPTNIGIGDHILFRKLPPAPLINGHPATVEIMPQLLQAVTAS